MHLLTRRRAIALLSALPGMPLARPAASRELRLAHLHTGEKLTVAYYSEGAYVPDALSALNRLFRDFRTDDVVQIDPALLDLLHDIAALTASRSPFQVISAYRSPRTNAALRRQGDGVASGSLHMKGQAVDIRLADVTLPHLRRAALALQRGGVGFYPRSEFVHVDTGRVRAW